VEETFVNSNAVSTLKLGHARACCLVAPARARRPVAQNAATVVKK
jgi:crossover junction endodeoxyribonuclease RuvC